MQKQSLAYYAARREECLVAAASCSLANTRQRQLDAAGAWQVIIDQLAVAKSEAEASRDI